MTTAAIVCGYDDFPSLSAYVELLRPEIAAAAPALLILTGGCTSPLREESEAVVLARCLGEVPHRVLLEEEAMSTVENLIYSRRFAEREAVGIDQWVVFCGRTHRLKVSALARLILGVNVRVIAVPRHVRWSVRLIEPLTIVFEVLAAVVPPLLRFVRAVSMRWRGVSGRRSAPQGVS